ncbi:MAG: GNAT family N-acetyltransferase, partial [Chloroflexota bacterium]
LLITGVAHPMVNSVVQTHLEKNGIEAKIQGLVDRFRKKRLPFMWYVWPNSSPSDLGGQLLEQGLSHSHDSPAMLANLAKLPDEVIQPDRLHIEQVRSEEMLADWRIPFELGYQLPDEVNDLFSSIYQHLGLTVDDSIQHFIAYLDDQPAACATMYYGKDGVAGVWNIATIPEARGKGIGTAITWQGCVDARQRGYEHAILLSSEMGYSVYQKLGFKEKFSAEVYVWQPPAK